MRLIHAKTYELKYFIGIKIPEYAILSHTWAEDEFVFEDLKVPIKDQLQNPKRGLVKVLKTCELAIKDGLEYVWVDTCCIDKSSSAELSEAINSMFRWYRRASACYVWLEDVSLVDGKVYDFGSSNWFRRGWTLQELIAPHQVDFYDLDWEFIADRYKLADRISRITTIGVDILLRKHQWEDRDDNSQEISDDLYSCPACNKRDEVEAKLRNTAIAVRLTWTRSRQTTRAEDRAYCLLGLFDVSMPLLYGEGDKAFRRLITEMLQNDADSSILLWTRWTDKDDSGSTLPSDLHPRDYAPMRLRYTYKKPLWSYPENEIILAPHGISVAVIILHPLPLDDNIPLPQDWRIAVLSPTVGKDKNAAVGIFVKEMLPPGSANQTLEMVYMRVARYTTVTIRKDANSNTAVATFQFRPLRDPIMGKGFFNMRPLSQHQLRLPLRESNPKRRITLTLSQSFSEGRTRSAPFHIDARHCGDYVVRNIYPEAMKTNEKQNTSFTFDSGIETPMAVIVALATSDLSSGFFVAWRRSNHSSDDEVVAILNWPALTGVEPTPVISRHVFEDGGYWLSRRHTQLRYNLDPFSSMAELKPRKGKSRHISFLDKYQARVMVVKESFLGIDRLQLVIEVGPSVPETAAAWKKMGVEI